MATRYQYPTTYNYQYQQPHPPQSNQIQTPYIPVDKRIFLFEDDEFFTENEWYGKVITAASATYQQCYRLFFAAIVMICFLAIPFVGILAGIMDSLLTLFVRPFTRPIGKITSDVMGYTYARALSLRNPESLV